VETGAQFCSTLRGMAEKKTEHGNRRFTVRQTSDGKPFLVVQLYQDTIPLLRAPNKMVMGGYPPAKG